MVNFAQAILLTEAQCQAVLALLADGPKAAGALVQNFSPERRPVVFRSLVWLVKLGVGASQGSCRLNPIMLLRHKGPLRGTFFVRG